MRLYAILLLGALLVAGCGDNPEPKPMPKPSSTPSASASATPPVMPEVAKEKSKKGAIAFARQYVRLVNHAQATGETAPLADIETEHSKSCKESRKAVEDLHRTGGSLDGGKWRVEALTATPNPASGGWLVTLIVQFGPQTIIRPSPQKSEELKGGRLPINLQVVWKSARWKVEQCTRGA